MKYFRWDIEKNQKLKIERSISFEEIVYHIQNGHLLDIIENPNSIKYKDQKIFVVEIKKYCYLVPFVEFENEIILKTIIPSRKATKKYIGKTGDKNE
jgi:hypothetical protein